MRAATTGQHRVKPISTKQHGVADYLFAGSALALPRALPASPRVRRGLDGSAAAVTVMSALTRYELGLVKLLPMRAHLALDLVVGPLFVAVPPLLRREARETRGAIAALGLAGTAVALLTEARRSAAGTAVPEPAPRLG